MNGYSRNQLANLLNISEQAVWQYENEYTSPKLETLNELKSIFHVRGTYFFNKDIPTRFDTDKQIPTMNIAYRSSTMNYISKTQTEAKHLSYLDGFIHYITENLSVPMKQIIELRNECIAYLNKTDANRDEQIYHIAQLARKRLQIDRHSNDDLLFSIEKSGVFVFEKAIGRNIDAYSLWTKDNRAFIILGNLKRSAARRNFDIAHELGHLLLHYKMEFTQLNKKDYRKVEQEANLFAGAFLLPEEQFRKDMTHIKYKTNPDAYIELKEKWNVSLQVLGYRAMHLNILTAREHRNFYASLHRKGYLKEEPLDTTIPIQRPEKMKAIFDLVVKKSVINFTQMLETDWRVNIKFLHHLTGIDLSFFETYVPKQANKQRKLIQSISSFSSK